MLCSGCIFWEKEVGAVFLASFAVLNQDGILHHESPLLCTDQHNTPRHLNPSQPSFQALLLASGEAIYTVQLIRLHI